MIPNIAPNPYGIPTLYVHDRPFIILGGELHNSSCSSPVYMEDQVWPARRALPLNTVIAPVYWETLEPVEGSFDYTLVDSLFSRPDAKIKSCFCCGSASGKTGKPCMPRPGLKTIQTPISAPATVPAIPPIPFHLSAALQQRLTHVHFPASWPT